MSISIDVPELLEVLRLTPTEQNILLKGKHGIGKSQLITHFYEKKKKKVVAFFLGQMSDPGDLIGLMYQDQKTGHSQFLPPYWWPTDNKPIVLFLDELNRARPEILQSVQDLTLNRTLAGKKLPKGSIVISAVNEGDEYQLTDLDPALLSRFNVYNFTPSVEDWLLWANTNKVDQRIVQFIQKNNQFLDSDEEQYLEQGIGDDLNKTPDRRAWVKVSDFIEPLRQIDAVHIKIIAGMVGVKAAMHFKKSLGEQLKVSPEELLSDFKRHQNKLKKFQLQDYIFLNEQLIYWLNSHYDKEYGEHTRKKNALFKNILAYLKYLKKVKKTEAIAHLASMLENKQFEKVAGILLAESIEIMMELEDYIGNI